MDVRRWAQEPVEQMGPGLTRQMVTMQHLTVARIHLAAGTVVPEHRHENEQVANVLEGSIRFVVDGEESVVGAGESLVLPSGVPHAATAITDAVILDVFSPRREDWLSGDDAYLRG